MKSPQRRSAAGGRPNQTAREIDLWRIVEYQAPPEEGGSPPDPVSGFVWDKDRREWKCRVVPFRAGWSEISLPETWDGGDEGGHWVAPASRRDEDAVMRWRAEALTRASWAWLPSWFRDTPDEEGFEDDPAKFAGNESWEGDPDLSAGDLVYCKRIEEDLHILSWPYTVVAFELKDALPALNAAEDNHPVDAYKRDWNSDAHLGWGGFDKNEDVIFKVADWRKVGYYGAAGANGAAEIRHCENGVIGVICDLECP